MEYFFKCDCGIIIRCQASNDIEGLRRLVIDGTKHMKSVHSDIKISEKNMKKIEERIRKEMKRK
ncbi:MAG: hypothetical protein J4428_00885 [Candidatus Aenigmarchaeota archaeon]|nr:hypothetical protein [Candidatus Aenigmarchaeota archaeon]